MLPKVYLDWNIFNKIESLPGLEQEEQKVYSRIEAAILNSEIITPYSNAHINDLIRGYTKNSTYIAGHLETLRRLTRNLCLTHYWGREKPQWHFRDVEEFFKSTLKESLFISKDFYSLYDYDKSDPLVVAMSMAHKVRCSLMKLERVDESFFKIYKEYPIFAHIYPRTKIEGTKYALTEDIYEFIEKIKSDYKFYKNFRRLLIELKVKYPKLAQVAEIDQTLQSISKSQPQSITWDRLWDDLTAQYSPKINPNFDRLFDAFVLTDLKGYRVDERFANLIDDGLHVYYGSRCDYFVTIDSRCFDKSQIVFKKFAPNTTAIKPEYFYHILTTNERLPINEK